MQHGNKTRGTGPLGGSGMVGLWGASSMIRSVQRGTISIASAFSATATINAVDVNNTVVRWLGTTSTSTGTTPAVATAGLTLTNSTTLTGVRQSNSATACVVSYEVIEFLPGVIRSVQRGNKLISSAPNTQTITEVNTAKSDFSTMGMELDVNAYRDDYEQTNAVLTNGTTLTFYMGYVGGGGIQYHWQVVEFF